MIVMACMSQTSPMYQLGEMNTLIICDTIFWGKSGNLMVLTSITIVFLSLNLFELLCM
jgi:hypothetical protein